MRVSFWTQAFWDAAARGQRRLVLKGVVGNRCLGASVWPCQTPKRSRIRRSPDSQSSLSSCLRRDCPRLRGSGTGVPGVRVRKFGTDGAFGAPALARQRGGAGCCVENCESVPACCVEHTHDLKKAICQR